MKIQVFFFMIISLLFISCANLTKKSYQIEGEECDCIKQREREEKLKNIQLKIITDAIFDNKINNLILNNKNPFVKQGDVVIDKDRDIMWQDDKKVAKTKMYWRDAKKYCKNLTLAGYSDWRLPTIDELSSIIDFSRYDPAIVKSFKNVTVSSPLTYVFSSTIKWEDFRLYGYVVNINKGWISFSYSLLPYEETRDDIIYYHRAWPIGYAICVRNITSKY